MKNENRNGRRGKTKGKGGPSLFSSPLLSFPASVNNVDNRQILLNKVKKGGKRGGERGI